MNDMIVTISVAELLFDIKNNSHIEIESQGNPEQNYGKGVGSENEEEILRLITTAVERLRSAIDRFISDPIAVDPSNEIVSKINKDSQLQFNFYNSVRKNSARMETLGQLIHAYIVNQALATYYDNVGLYTISRGKVAGGPAVVKATEAQNCVSDILRVLYSKNPPRRTLINE